MALRFSLRASACMALLMASEGALHAATCPVPNIIANGQVADASKVMDDIIAVANCAETAVTATGTPTTGSLAVFSGSQSVASGDLSGDVTTSGGTSTTLSSTGVTPGSYTSANIIIDAKGRITSASSSPGSGSSSSAAPISALRDALRIYSVEHRTMIDTNSFINGMLNWGGLVGFVFEGMASSNDSSLYKGTTFTVPAGKHAIIVDSTSNLYDKINPAYYAVYLYNDTTNYWVAASNQKSVADGYVLADNNYWVTNAYTAQDSEVSVAVAGDVIDMRINNPSNDGIKRSNSGTFILAIVDDVTGKVDPIVPN